MISPPVWQYFGYLKQKISTDMKCLYCDKFANIYSVALWRMSQTHWLCFEVVEVMELEEEEEELGGLFRVSRPQKSKKLQANALDCSRFHADTGHVWDVQEVNFHLPCPHWGRWAGGLQNAAMLRWNVVCFRCWTPSGTASSRGSGRKARMQPRCWNKTVGRVQQQKLTLLYIILSCSY